MLIKYDVSPSQLLSFQLGTTVSCTQIEFNQAIGINIMEKVWIEFINNYGLLKSSIIINNTESSIVEYECKNSIKLPFADISFCTKDVKNNIIDAIFFTSNEYKNKKNYNNKYLTNRVILLKMNESNYRLLLVSTHLIFDGA